MASITGYSVLPGGGYLVSKDDGSQIPMAFMPPALKAQLDAQAPMRPDSDEDLRTADLGDVWQGTKNLASDVGSGLGLTPDAASAIRAREASQGNYSGIHNTDVASYEDARARGLDVKAPPSSGPATKAPERGAAPGPVQEVPLPGGGPVGGGPRYTVSPGQLVRGGERKAGEADVTTEYDPSAQANLKRGQQNEYEATDQMIGAAERGNRNVANAMGEIPGTLGKMDQLRQEAEARRQSAIDSDMAEMNKIRQETREGIHDPDEDRPIAGKLAAGIGIVLGSLGSGLLGRPNEVAAMVDRQAQKLVDIQKTNLANKRARFEDKRSALADNMKRFQDARQGELATKGSYLEQMQSKVQAYMAEAKTDEEKAKGQMALAGLQKASAANELEMSKITRQIHTHVVPDKVVGGGPVKSEIDPEQYVPEAGGFALRKDVPPDMNKKFAATKNLTNTLAQIRRIGATVDERTDPAARAQLDSLVGQFIVQYKEANQMGALDKGTQEVGEKILGDPKALLGIGREQTIDNLSRNMQSSTRSLQHAYGILPGSVQVVVDPTTGQRRAIGVLSGEQLNEGAGGGGGQSYGFTPAGGGR